MPDRATTPPAIDPLDLLADPAVDADPGHAAAMLGGAIRRGAPAAEVAQLRRELAAANVAKAIRENVAKAGPLTPVQRALLAGMLDAEA